ncbi:hypothetical protein [Sphingomonas sp. BAUL-RG-20F-R05-02]|uniref:hypothetical protein n=1 Tax=Sphingomonas sp. BAUL-RG-20F-R05-02 TaxID=2914830 RepID=UPI001F5A78D9|nr:hypothetical protein [Sphingomonas sp. BAUL-RG-20F-R05-02]
MVAVVFYQAESGAIDGVGDLPEQEAIRTGRPFLIVDEAAVSLATTHRVENDALVAIEQAGGQHG